MRITVEEEATKFDPSWSEVHEIVNTAILIGFDEEGKEYTKFFRPPWCDGYVLFTLRQRLSGDMKTWDIKIEISYAGWPEGEIPVGAIGHKREIEKCKAEIASWVDKTKALSARVVELQNLMMVKD